MVSVEKLTSFLLIAGDDPDVIEILAGPACDEGGCRKFARVKLKMVAQECRRWPICGVQWRLED